MEKGIKRNGCRKTQEKDLCWVDKSLASIGEKARGGGREKRQWVLQDI